MKSIKRNVKRVLFSTALVALISSCETTTSSDDNGKSEASSIIDSINVDYKGENNAVFYKLSTKTATTIKHDIWDIAIDDGLKIVSNSGDYGIGVNVLATEITQFDTDLSSYADSAITGIENVSFSDSDPFDGWIAYDPAKGGVIYSGKVFIVKTEDGTFYKVQFTAATKSAGVSVTVKIDTLSGTGATETVFTKDDVYDRVYIDLGTKASVAFAPATSDWDIKFARGQQKAQMSDGSFVPYGMSAISLNSSAEIQAYLIENTSLEEVTAVETGKLSSEINAIGKNWYTFSGRPDLIFTCDEDVAVIKTENANYKLQMATFYGGADGSKQFTSIFAFDEIK